MDVEVAYLIARPIEIQPPAKIVLPHKLGSLAF